MKQLYLKFFNLLFISSLLFSFTSNSQNTSQSTKNIMETINASGSNASGSSGSVTYSIGQVFYTYIGESVYNVAQGIQHEQVDPESIAGTVSENQMICSYSQPSPIMISGNTGAIQWQSSLDNVNFIDIAGATTNTLSSADIGTVNVTKYFKAVVTSGTSAPAISDTVRIEISTTNWNGAVWSNGVPSATTSASISGNYNVSANITACTLTINNNAVVTIPSGFSVTLSGAITVSSGSFTLNNDANLIQLSNVANTGNIIVNRNSSALLRLDYTMWSSPVTNTNQSLQTFSPATSVNRFYSYNSSTNLYNTVLNPSTTNFAVGQGYLIRMPNDASATIRSSYAGVFTGVPNNGTISISLANDGIGKRFNLVGNPYPSPISVSKFVADNIANITGTLYFWRKTNNAGSPSYCTWAGGTLITNGESQVVNPNGIIQTGQGFFVEALDTATTVTFNNAQRVNATSNQFFKTKTIERNTIWLNATNAAGAFSQMAVGYITNATLGADEYDGKYYNDGMIALNSFLDKTDYAIQGRPLPFDGTDEVPLSFKATNAGEYTIAIDHVDGLFVSSQDIILKDDETGTETNLKLNPYTFTAAAGSTNARFSLKYQKTLGITASTVNNNRIVLFNKNEKIVIKSDSSLINNVKIYDVSGKLLHEKSNVKAIETSIDSSKFIGQLLIVKIVSDNNTVVNRKIVI